MSYVQALLPAAVAEDFADAVAREKCIQFTDLNEDLQPFQRQFTSDIIKIQEIERKIKSIEEIVDEYKVCKPTEFHVTGYDIESSRRPQDSTQIISDIDREVSNEYKSLLEQARAEKQLQEELISQEATVNVLSGLEGFLNVGQHLVHQHFIPNSNLPGNDASRPDSMPLIELTQQRRAVREVAFKFLAGVVTIGQRVAFERQVFLTCRGNSFVQFDEERELEDDNGRTNIPFVVFFLGDELKRSLRKLCQFMGIRVCYDSEDQTPRHELLEEARQQRMDFMRIHMATESQLLRNIQHVSELVKGWKVALVREKAILVTLNKFQTHANQANVVRAQGWCPESKCHRIEEILDDVTRGRGVGNAVLTPCDAQGTIPTHFETNDFTRVFQLIVDTYGVPRYQEFNPAVPTIVTFPFLFGVMYGDMFHASFLLLFAIVLVSNTLRKRVFGKAAAPGGSLEGLFAVRYILLLMGFFALYCGLIYNDVMSLSINGFNGAQWEHVQVQLGDKSATVAIQKQDVYAIGVDPDWHGKTNQLSYMNSLKMKLSVIIGVVHMTFGLFLKLANHIHEQDRISIYCEFVPQLIFMSVFFIYMDFLIIYKWCIDWSTSELEATPSVITILIKMVLSPGMMSKDTVLYDEVAQTVIQVMLVILMFLSIPWILIPKPFLLRAKHNETRERAAMERYYLEEDAEVAPYTADFAQNLRQKPDETHIDEDFDFGEAVIHQLIHTIEYVLGTVSNTASYLRLWALSLAHAKLAEVFYQKTLEMTLSFSTLQYSGMQAVLMKAAAVMVNVGSVFFFILFTFGVLIVMDILECFLHALRLHWVEFQNKFYYADGVAFVPFTYKSELENKD